MFDTQNNCPDCREFKKNYEHNHPYPADITKFIYGGFAVAAIFIPAGIVASVVEQDIASFNFFTTVLFAVAVGGGIFLRYFYWPHNVRGYTAYAFLTFAGETHRHLHDPLGSQWRSEMRFGIKETISGKWKAVDVQRGHLDAESNVLESSFGEQLRISSRRYYSNGFNRILTDDYEVVLGIATRQGLQAMLESAKNAEEALVELMVLEKITAQDDPLNLGKSKHGQTVHGPILSLVRRLANNNDIQERAQERAKEMVRGLHAKASEQPHKTARP